MNHLPLIIKREYVTKIRNKSFMIMTFLSPLIFVGLVAFISYLSQLNANEKRTIVVLDDSGLFADVFKTTQNTTYTYLTNLPLATAKDSVKQNEYYGLLHIGHGTLGKVSKQISYFSEDAPALGVVSSLEEKIERKLKDLKLVANGIDIAQVNASETTVVISQEGFDGQKSSKIDNYLKLGFGMALGYLLFMFIIIYGNLIMRSVIEEKTTRIIEIIISSVKPIHLMLGKIIGTSLAGITQFVIWLVLGLVLFIGMGFLLNINTVTPQQEVIDTVLQTPEVQSQVTLIFQSVSHLPITNLIIAFLMFFIGGYLLYSSLYAAIGAAVDNETDTQQFILPLLVPLMLSIYIGFFTVINDPHGTVSTVFSFIPFTSPVIMLMRIPFDVPLWQQVLSFAILIATFVGAVWLASKIYRVGILMYGKKPSYKELIKWLKY